MIVPRGTGRRESERTRRPGNRSVGFPNMDLAEMLNVTAMLMSFVPHDIFRVQLLIQLNTPPYLP
jgi:hypothetical protein